MIQRQKVKSTIMLVTGLASGAMALAVPFAASAQVSDGALDYNARDVMLGVGARYESNIARSNGQTASQRGLHRSDVTFSPMVTFNLGLPIADRGLYLSGQAGYDFHARNTELDRERLAVSLVGAAARGVCELEPTMSISRQQSDLANLLVGGPVVPVTARNALTTQDYAARLSCGDAIGFRPAIEASRSMGDNTDRFRQLSDHRTWEYGSGVRYSHPNVGELYAFIRRSDTRFPERLTPVQRDGYRNISYGLTASRDIGSSLRASATVAKNSMRVADPLIDGFDGLTWNVALTATPGPRTQITGTVGRELGNPQGTTAGYTITENYGINGSYAASDRLTLTGGFNHSPRKYGLALLPGVTFPGSDRQSTAYLSAAFRLNQRMDLGVDLGRDWRRADGTLYDYTNNFAGLSLRWRL